MNIQRFEVPGSQVGFVDACAENRHANMLCVVERSDGSKAVFFEYFERAGDDWQSLWIGEFAGRPNMYADADFAGATVIDRVLT